MSVEEQIRDWDTAVARNKRMGRQHPIIEILDRVRRIETRLTAGLESLGATVTVDKPVYEADNDRVVITSMDARLKDIVAVLPCSIINTAVVHGGRVVAWMSTDATD